MIEGMVARPAVDPAADTAVDATAAADDDGADDADDDEDDEDDDGGCGTVSNKLLLVMTSCACSNMMVIWRL